MKNLTFGQIIKTMQKEDENTYFKVPSDIYPDTSILLSRFEARKHLANINLYWRKKNLPLRFNIKKEEAELIWDKDECSQIERKIHSRFKSYLEVKEIIRLLNSLILLKIG